MQIEKGAFYEQTCFRAHWDPGCGGLPQLAQAVEACPGRWLACESRRLQFHILSFLGQTWCRGGRPELPDEQLLAATKKLADKGGVVTYDVPIQTSGLIPQPLLDQLQAVGHAMQGSAQ